MKKEKPPTSKACATCGDSIEGGFEKVECATCEAFIYDCFDKKGERLGGKGHHREEDNKRICNDCYAEEYFRSIPDKPIKEKVCDLLNELILTENIMVFSPRNPRDKNSSEEEFEVERSVEVFTTNGSAIQISLLKDFILSKK